MQSCKRMDIGSSLFTHMRHKGISGIRQLYDFFPGTQDQQTLHLSPPPTVQETETHPILMPKDYPLSSPSEELGKILQVTFGLGRVLASLKDADLPAHPTTTVQSTSQAMFLPQVSGIFQRKSIYYYFLVVNRLLNTVSLNTYSRSNESLDHCGLLHTIKVNCSPTVNPFAVCYCIDFSLLPSLFFCFWCIKLQSTSNSRRFESGLQRGIRISYSFRGLGISLLLSHLFSKTHRIGAILTPPAHLPNSTLRMGNQKVQVMPRTLRCPERPLPVLWFLSYAWLQASTATSCYLAPNCSTLRYSSQLSHMLFLKFFCSLLYHQLPQLSLQNSPEELCLQVSPHGSARSLDLQAIHRRAPSYPSTSSSLSVYLLSSNQQK